MSVRVNKHIVIPIAVHAALFILVILGLVPREIVPFWTIGLLIWGTLVPAHISIPFFVAVIPLFIAIPITPEYDNLTMWRPLSIIIFLRWFLTVYSRHDIVPALRTVIGALRHAPRRHPVSTSLVSLAVIATLSLFIAPDINVAVRRIMLFVNASFVPLVLLDVMRHDRSIARAAVLGMAFSAMTITTVALVQIASTYFIDIYQFMRFWGEGIQLRQFGTLWSDIAVRLGNTWFAYYGAQLSLRAFSLFPDSHSFPIYLIVSTAGLMALSVKTLMRRAGEKYASIRSLLLTRANLGIVWIPAALLAIILSGTRGIWAAAAGLPLVSVVVWFWLRRVPKVRALWLWLSSFFIVFALLFTVAYPIFTSPQFLLSKGDWTLFGQRIRSIVDFGETSNAQRIDIWQKTMTSIRNRPLMGVGIGNFPVILDQQIFLSRAGSSAHNIYLHIAAEMGVFALAAWLWLWMAIYWRTFRRFTTVADNFWRGYYGWLLLALPWIAAYLLTDAALFDERTLLLFGITIAIVSGNQNHHE